jgi:hypothetical protein
MPRQGVHSRTTLTGLPAPEGRSAAPVRRSAARPGAALARLLLAPFAAVVAAAAGLLFAVLLPICGIATIAEAVAKASWRLVRDALAPPASHRPAHRT